MKQIITTVVLSMACYTVCEGARRPNIPVIMADDMGYADTGFTGATASRRQPGPLAASGVVFTWGYANQPFCAPTGDT
jgi:arylsulfatase A-like enzyme